LRRQIEEQAMKRGTVLRSLLPVLLTVGGGVGLAKSYRWSDVTRRVSIRADGVVEVT
jgi:hypothetical protein